MPTAEPDIVRRMRLFMQDLREQENASVRDMARRWAQVESALEAQIELLARQVAEMGAEASQAKLFQLARYTKLLEQARREVDGFAAFAAERITKDQRAAGKAAVDAALESLQTMLSEAGEITTGFDRLPKSAIDAMIGMLADGSPLVELLRASFPEAADGLTRALLEGVALGKGPREVARMMRRAFGIPLDRAMAIARTEMQRVHREAARMQYQASGVVTGYRRLATHDGRACLACILTEGQFYALEESFSEHVQGRCTLVPAVIGVGAPEWLAGADWLRAQPADVQRATLGPKRYELWKSGEVSDLSQFVDHRHDPVWGGAFVPKPIKDLATRAA